MNKEYSILMQREGIDETCTDLQDAFGFVCTDIRFSGVKIKEPEHTDWMDKDGDDVFIPSVMRLSSTEAEMSIVYSGAPNTYRMHLDDLIAFLTGRDTGLGSDGIMLYSAFHNRGYRNCYFKEIKDLTLCKLSNTECAEFTMVVQVCDPISSIKPNKRADGNYELLKI